MLVQLGGRQVVPGPGEGADADVLEDAPLLELH
jgi:hypothetical protein